MFLIGSLFALCGLLAQTTAYMAGQPLILSNSLPTCMDHCRPLPVGTGVPLTVAPGLYSYPSSHYARDFRDAFSRGLLSGGLLGFLENLPLLNILKPTGSSTGGLFGVVGKVISSVPILNNILDPAVGHLLELAVKLDVTAEIYAVRDIQGRSRLIIGDCLYPPGSLRISLLNGLSPLQKLVDGLTDILTKVLPGLVQGTVCPLVNGILSILDVTLLHNIADFLLDGVQFVIKV
ncbi:BPI fold-containing family A member 5-like [Nannospalax galili]|uniref:BPI fold-containing family A member 5-like n=1 Tax=Nannospalax galili TaxID=1026970 RepID=UPI0004ED4AE6|nr:BPI fold-containing family A member 5-like [Nannospalax galili]